MLAGRDNDDDEGDHDEGDLNLPGTASKRKKVTKGIGQTASGGSKRSKHGQDGSSAKDKQKPRAAKKAPGKGKKAAAKSKKTQQIFVDDSDDDDDAGDDDA